MTCPEQANPETEMTSVVPGGRGRWGQGVTDNGYRVSFWGDENLKLAAQLCEDTKTNESCTL